MFIMFLLPVLQNGVGGSFSVNSWPVNSVFCSPISLCLPEFPVLVWTAPFHTWLGALDIICSIVEHPLDTQGFVDSPWP